MDIALRLSPDERAELAERLLESLPQRAERDGDWDDAWAEEVERRSKDGPEHWVDGHEALRSLFGTEG